MERNEGQAKSQEEGKGSCTKWKRKGHERCGAKSNERGREVGCPFGCFKG